MTAQIHRFPAPPKPRVLRLIPHGALVHEQGRIAVYEKTSLMDATAVVLLGEAYRFVRWFKDGAP